MQLFVAGTTSCGKHMRHRMSRFEIVGIDHLAGIAELGELLLADFDLLVFFSVKLFSLSDMALYIDAAGAGGKNN